MTAGGEDEGDRRRKERSADRWIGLLLVLAAIMAAGAMSMVAAHCEGCAPEAYPRAKAGVEIPAPR